MTHEQIEGQRSGVHTNLLHPLCCTLTCFASCSLTQQLGSMRAALQPHHDLMSFPAPRGKFMSRWKVETEDTETAKIGSLTVSMRSACTVAMGHSGEGQIQSGTLEQLGVICESDHAVCGPFFHPSASAGVGFVECSDICDCGGTLPTR